MIPPRPGSGRGAPSPAGGAPTPQLAAAAAMMGEGRYEDARSFLLRHIQSAGARAHPHALYMLGVAADALNEPQQATHYFERAAAAAPHEITIAVGLANALANAWKLEEAAKSIAAFAAAHLPDAAVASTQIKILLELDREDEALRIAEAAHAALGDNAELAGALGPVLLRVGRPEDALALYRRAGRIVKEGSMLFSLGRIEDAIAHYRTASEKFPNDSSAWGHYAFTQNYSDIAPAAEQARAHREFGRSLRATAGPAFTSWNVSKDPNRPLRVGILSPDLRRHAVISFLAPLLENYDKSDWHLIAYCTTRRQDDVTARLRTLVDEWRDIPNPYPPYLASRIRSDRVDVLIELSGLTENNALPAVHRRPAPVQVTAIGYPNTTGLDTIHHRIVDSITDPPGADVLAVEKLARIDPCFLCYKPIVDAPELVPPPSAAGAPIALGSFNLPSKISPRTLALWGRTLQAIPGSTLILKHAALKTPWMRKDLIARLAAAGIDQSRVTVLPPMPSYSDHLAAYAHIDIALDTFPYHGTTTTCEALWMGVPVITLTGDRHASRVGTSLLNAVGLPDLAAADEADFIRIVSSLAKSPDRLRAWRTPGPASLRAVMAASALCDAKSFSSRFQAAIRQAWQSWCANPR